MPLRMILRKLLNSEKLVQQLSESYAIRRAAQLTAYAFHKGKAIGEDTLENLKESPTTSRVKEEAQHVKNRFQSFSQNVSQEIREGFKDMNEELKKQKK